MKRRLADSAYDYLGELFALAQKAVVHYRKPIGVEEIRAYEPSLRVPALVFLLEGYERDRSWDEDLRCEIARWSDSLWEQDDFWEQDGEGEKELLPLVDADVQSVEDLVRWFRRNERLLDIC